MRQMVLRKKHLSQSEGHGHLYRTHISGGMTSWQPFHKCMFAQISGPVQCQLVRAGSTSPVWGSWTALRPTSLMCVWGKSSLEGDSPMLIFLGRLTSSGLPLPLLVIMSLIAAAHTSFQCPVAEEASWKEYFCRSQPRVDPPGQIDQFLGPLATFWDYAMNSYSTTVSFKPMLQKSYHHTTL